MYSHKNKHLGHIVSLGAIAIFITALGSALWANAQMTNPPPVVVIPPHCTGEQNADFQCWKKRYELLTRQHDPAHAYVDLKREYARNGFVMSQCHQLAHVIGNTAAEMYPSVSEAFAKGDSFCWSGYYHGVMERAVSLMGIDKAEKSLNEFCTDIPGKDKYSFDYYNCVHGLGHGLMSITRNELFDSLKFCDNLSGDWERQSCWGGAFMENVMADNRNHKTKYLKPDDLVYPCNAVDQKYKQQCYLMQTSYMLSKNGSDFKNVFELCQQADADFQDTCAESAGRDASGQSISNTEKTRDTCALALNDRQHEHCIVGAVKDFISYHHDDTKAHELCAAVPSKFKDSCETTANLYYQSFK
jgi:hypothetical protein